MSEGKTIDRSAFSIISFQLEGFCQALRATIPHGLEPGAGTIQILKKLRDDWAAITTGKALDDLPEVDDNLSPVDVLAMAETLRATVLSFMNPEEFVQQQRAFGFTQEP
jgi:hypothetical protein